MAEAVTRASWAHYLLDELDAPDSSRNRTALVAWVSAEGTTAKWNPLATTRNWPGATNFNSVGVKNYASLTDGIEATVATLLEPNHGYEPIVESLRKGRRARRTLAAVESSQWGTGGLALLVLKSIRRYDSYRTYARQIIGQ